MTQRFEEIGDPPIPKHTLLRTKLALEGTTAQLILLKNIKVRPGVTIKYEDQFVSAQDYECAGMGLKLKGNNKEFVYVLFQLSYKGEKKRRFYRFTTGTFLHCFYENLHTENLASHYNVCDEYGAHKRVEKIMDFIAYQSACSVPALSVEQMDKLVVAGYAALVEGYRSQVTKRSLWREVPRPRL